MTNEEIQTRCLRALDGGVKTVPDLFHYFGMTVDYGRLSRLFYDLEKQDKVNWCIEKRAWETKKGEGDGD